MLSGQNLRGIARAAMRANVVMLDVLARIQGPLRDGLHSSVSNQLFSIDGPLYANVSHGIFRAVRFT